MEDKMYTNNDAVDHLKRNNEKLDTENFELKK